MMEIIGNIATDLKLEHTANDVPYVKFRVARDTFKTVDGERTKASTLFFSVTAWRALAEGIVAALEKGSPIVGVGRWEASDYETRDGEARHAQWIVAEALGPDLRRSEATVTRRGTKAPSAETESDATADDEDPFNED